MQPETRQLPTPSVHSKWMAGLLLRSHQLLAIGVRKKRAECRYRWLEKCIVPGNFQRLTIHL